MEEQNKEIESLEKSPEVDSQNEETETSEDDSEQFSERKQKEDVDTPVALSASKQNTVMALESEDVVNQEDESKATDANMSDTPSAENAEGTDGTESMQAETSVADTATTVPSEASTTTSATSTTPNQPTDSTTRATTNQPTAPPTDEFGRELSAYELLRQQRIQRNKERLAQLGLDDMSKKMKAAKAKTPTSSKKRVRTVIPLERRERISRKTKIHNVNYKELTKIPNEPPKLGLKNESKATSTSTSTSTSTTTTPRKRIRSSGGLTAIQKRVPLFMYRELKNIESQRRLGLKAAERTLRLADKECKYAHKQIGKWSKKRLKIQAKQEKRRALLQAEQERKWMGPFLYELDRRRWELVAVRRKQIAVEQQREGWAVRKRQEMVASVKMAETKFPALIEQQSTILGNMLLERLPSISKDEGDSKSVAVKKTKKGRKGKKQPPQASHSTVETEEGSNNQLPESCSPVPNNVELDPENLATINHQQAQQKANPEPKKPKRVKARNIGGPVTSSFSTSLQRKWLEGDSPVAPSGTSPFVPQVGDTVLYYPCAHKTFLEEYPDVRCKMNRLILRRPLWVRAQDEQEDQEMASKPKAVDEKPLKRMLPGEEEVVVKAGKKKEKKEVKKIWWTKKWISSILKEEGDNAGSYPILCRVERAVAEFPFDSNSVKELRKSKAKAKQRRQSKGDDDGEEPMFKGSSGRRIPRRIKLPIGLNVTLKPLSKIIPPEPRQIGKATKRSLRFAEKVEALPPLFSVLITPSDHVAPFLLPFTWAYRLPLTFSVGDHVKVNSCAGSARKAATIVSSTTGEEKNFQVLLKLFQDITKNDFDTDLSSAQGMSDFISECYANSSLLELSNTLPEQSVRFALQTIFYQIHKRKDVLKDSIVEEESEARESSNVLLKSTNKGRCASSLGNLVNWIKTTLPRYKGVKVKVTSSSEDIVVSPWELVTEDSSKSDQNKNGFDALARALAPSILLSSTSTNNGCLTYTMDESLRIQVELGVKHLIETHEKAVIFVPPVTDIVAPGYSSFVPIGMSLRRILRRLKQQEMKFPTKDQVLRSDDPTEQQAVESSTCCYYRNLGSLLSDVADIYQNCLLYNDPDSAIVAEAHEVTNQVKKLVESIETNWKRKVKLKEKEERDQARDAELVASGQEGLHCRSKYSAKLGAESNDASFYGSLTRSWIHSTGRDSSVEYPNENFDDEGDSTSRSRNWLPQCGDRIMYNRQLHAQFIHGHFKCLSSHHRILPPVLPSKRHKKRNGTVKDSEEDKVDYWMLGTVVWMRAVFPRELPDGFSETFDELSPILALGIQFHYNWLSNKIHIVYWRPCSLSNKNELFVVVRGGEAIPLEQLGKKYIEKETHCKHCSLSSSHSFICPAWKGPIEKLLPPYPLKLADVRTPIRIPCQYLKKLHERLGAMKRRCVNNIPIKSCTPQPIPSNLEQMDVPERFRHIFYDSSEDEGDKRTVEPVDFREETKELRYVSFLSPWIANTTKPKNRGPARRKKNVSYEEKSEEKPFFNETIMPAPELSLALIEERIQNSHYRSMGAIVHDIREAFASSVIYIVKEAIHSKRIDEKSGRKILLVITNSAERGNISKEQGKVSLPLATEHNTSGKRIDISALDTVAVEIARRIQSIQTFHAASIACLVDPLTADVALGLTSMLDVQLNHTNSNETTNVSSKEARKNADMILSALGSDLCLFRRPITRADPLPTIKVKVKMQNFGSSDFLGRQKQRQEKETSDGTVLKSGFPEVKVEDISGEEEQVLVDINQPILLTPSDYSHNDNLIGALFCFMDRKSVCFRCRLAGNSLLTCRVRKAHSNVVFSCLDYYNQIGGFNGLMKSLEPSYIPPATAALFSPKLTMIPSKGLSHKGGQPISDGNGDSTVISSTQEIKEEGFLDLTVDIEEEKKAFEVFEKAKRGVELAKILLKAATNASKAPLTLSDSFIESNFPVDPTDGHFEICTVCGLGGDVLCCETCPIVVHPKCVGLETVPEGDWYCPKCSTKKDKENDIKDNQSEQSSNESKALELSYILDELQSLRPQKEKSTKEGESGNKEEDEEEEEEIIGEFDIFQSVDLLNQHLPLKRRSRAPTRFHDADSQEGEVVDNSVEKTPVQKVKHSKLRDKGATSKDVSSANKKTRRFKNALQETKIDDKSFSKKLIEKRGRGRPRKITDTQLESNVRSIGTNEESPKRKTGRPRKIVAYRTIEHEKSGMKRGRSKSKSAEDSAHRVKKERRGRKGSQSRVLSVENGDDEGAESFEDIVFPPDPAPRPGSIDRKMRYYCSMENDTSITIAKKLGCTSWRDIAFQSENRNRYGSALSNSKTRFKKGTYLRIPAEYSLSKAMALIDESQ